MASQIDGGTVLNLEERGRRLLTRWSEQLLALELEDERGLRARVAQGTAEGALYRHLYEALAKWQTPQHPRGAAGPRRSP
ncbi:MAG: hypothetical protein DLM67_25980 [Candidatus Nephthysia bennettiae]|uniref:Uncharacterized protein n=1 Tax=Candidatus Nephthysia bennettiae TaxID=3127016 RepID=A0A934K5G1_9BACT|nr:hypothetical protein [Candidatus Dormibacteraeota bacterium]PZR85300.1 MAG: hypothetical protein DLM67_25980 [Candidatus Dormibacteraeota bacterium]